MIGWPTTNVVATFKSFDLKETWLNKLTEQIQEERGKQLPKSLMLGVLNKEIDKVKSIKYLGPELQCFLKVKAYLS